MSNPWFRMYSEWLDDEKVQMEPFDIQRHLVALFCLRCQRPLDQMTDQQIAFRLRITLDEMKRCKERFMQLGIIENNWFVCNWNKRQFISDSSTERVRKLRNKRKAQGLKQDETLHETDETGNVTPPEQNRTDTEQIQNHKKPIARSVPPEELAGTLPLVDGTDYLVSKSQMKNWGQAYPGIDVKIQLAQFKVWLVANPTRQKTPRGIQRAIIHWLSGAQNKSQGKPNGSINHGGTKMERTVYAAGEVISQIENSDGADGIELFSRG